MRGEKEEEGSRMKLPALPSISEVMGRRRGKEGLSLLSDINGGWEWGGDTMV